MRNLSRREFLRTCVAAGAVSTLSIPASCLSTISRRVRAAGWPNIVFILADDYGLDGVGCCGSDRHKNRTPNLDALARGGIRFERRYLTPLCGPTRCQIMTGRYPFRTGGLTNKAAGNPVTQNEYPLARILKETGYSTCHVGKWRQMGQTPHDWSFDEYITDPTAGGWFWKNSYTLNGKLVELEKEIYYPDVTHEFAMDFLQRHAAGGPASGKPFFLYYSSHLVHGPIVRTPDTKTSKQEVRTLYDDNASYLDKQVGLVVAELDRLKLRENTLIIFSGDNGTVAAQTGTIGGRKINGNKSTMLEGGSRVPLIANWKSVMPSGIVLKDLVDFSDLLPTFAEVAGAKVPLKLKYDGQSFAPQLHGNKGKQREWIFVQLGRNWYVRNDGWKLNQAGELFDMNDSPFVEKLVPSDSKDKVAISARKELGAVLKKLNPASGKTI